MFDRFDSVFENGEYFIDSFFVLKLLKMFWYLFITKIWKLIIFNITLEKKERMSS